MIIDCKKIKDEILEQVKKDAETLHFPPIFCDILVGDDPISASYVRIKARNAESVGIKFRTANYPKEITTEELLAEIEHLNNVPHMCGIIVQLPLPSHIDKNKVLDAIKPELDVDCLGQHNSTLFYQNMGEVVYPTALACMRILDSVVPDLTGKKVAVLGQGNLVGKPVSHILESRGYMIARINRHTENIKDLLKNADVIISAIGQGKFLTSDMVKEGVIIIDAGTSEEDGGIVGDVDMASVQSVASFVTSTPGGVGPVTVAMLLLNVVNSAKRILKV